MKRILSIAIMFIMLSGSAYADEVLFRGIPWGSKLEDVREQLERDGFGLLLTNASKGVYWNQYIRSIENDMGGWHLAEEYTDNVCGWVLFDFRPGEENEPKVAGYAIDGMYLNFVYSTKNGFTDKEEYNGLLYRATYSLNAADYNNAFDEITSKMRELYGDWTEISVEVKRWVSERNKDVEGKRIARCFFGDYDTAVVVETVILEDIGQHLLITYGATGWDSELSIVDEKVSQEELQKRLDEERNTDRTGVYDGL